MELLSTGTPFIAAHRGTSGGNIPCNSLAAYKAAVFQGADIIELDVTKSKDEKLFCFHPMMEFSHLCAPILLPGLSARQISRLRYRNFDSAKTTEGVLSLDDAFEFLKGKCLLNIDKFWTAPALISNCIKRHGLERQVIVKTPAKKEYFDALECLAPDLAFMPMIKETDNISKMLLKRKLNFVGIEAIFKSEDAQVISDENIAFLHKNSLAVWGNAIVYNRRSIISAGHTDDIAVTGNPDFGWGWFKEKGFDIIQTDWVFQMKEYFKNKNSYERID